MKKIILLFIASIILFSCKKEIENTAIENLKTQKITLLNKIDSLNTELQKVEEQILKLDPNKNLQIVTTLPVTKTIFKHYVEIQGTAKTDKNIEIRPELGGVVNAIYVKEGQKVQAGQLLIQLEDSSIKNSINELNTQLRLAKTTFERQERLWNQKIGSEMQYLQAKAKKEGLENNLKTLKTQAKKMKIIASFSGIVDEIFPKKGELTNPQFPVLRLLNLDKIYVEADVTETYLPVIKMETEVIVYFSSINKKITSEITQVGNYINPNNRSFKVRINIPNKDQSIKPNLLANIKILDFEKEGIVIPSTLIQQDQNGNNYVFTITTKNNQNIVLKTTISIGKEYNHQVFVSEGLTENDILVNKGARLIKAGDSVTIQ